MKGRVVLVGAGPGDPDLLTVRAVRELERAEVLLYDALISPAILALASPDCERIDVGKRGDGSKGVKQSEIAELMILHARRGRAVVRLKGGDPYVFGRGAEEATALSEAGIPFEVVPGISSALAVPSYAGIPLTDRRFSSSFTVVTGHRGKEVEDERTDWEGLARSSETLVILMGTAWLPDIVARVLRGRRDPATPCAVIASGTTARQRVVCAPLHSVVEAAQHAGLTAPTVVVIGDVVRFRASLATFERRPLFGQRVLILRAADQSGELAVRLAAAGAEPVVVPLLAFAASEQPDVLRAALERAAAYDWLVFTSANAVRFSAPWLPKLRADARPRIACIGPVTGAAAARAGLAVQLLPEGPAGPASLVEALASHGSLAGAQILLPRAGAATAELPDALRARGARVDCVEAYRNVEPPGAVVALRAAVSEQLDAVVFTSPSTVARLFAILGERELHDLAKRCALISIGPSTGAALRERGLTAVREAAEASSEGLVAALETHFAEGEHGVS